MTTRKYRTVYRSPRLTTELVSRVKANVPGECLAKKCKREGCSVTLKEAPKSHVIINVDCKKLPIWLGDSKCDFIFISDEGKWVVPIELKKGSPDASHIVGQLRAGAKLAEAIVPDDVEVRFRPVAAYGGKPHPIELRKFRRPQNFVSFKSKSIEVKLLKCGDPLAKALKDSAP